jgi:hypothetical protein
LRRSSGVRFDYRLDLPDQSGSGRIGLQTRNTVEGGNRVCAERFTMWGKVANGVVIRTASQYRLPPVSRQSGSSHE